MRLEFLSAETLVYSYPPFYMYVPGGETLEPGACLKYAISWDLSEDPAPVGTYKAWGGLYEVNVDTWPNPLGFWLYPSTSAELFIEVTDQVGTEEVSWDGVKATYR